MLKEREAHMKRRPLPEQGSMLLLMNATLGPVNGSTLGRHKPEPAITHEVRDDQDNVLEMSHEPVMDPMDDKEEEDAFNAFYITNG